METVVVRAKIELLPTNQAGWVTPICANYRPNHNFFDEDPGR